MSQKIRSILKAAQDTASYIDMMRMPTDNQPITKYATLKTSASGKPELQETGFTMLSPNQAKTDEMVTKTLGYGFFPVVFCLGVVNGMNASTKSGKIFNYSTSIISLISMRYYIGKNKSFVKAPTLIFPQVNK
jgi:hypothetical protein